MGGDTGKSIRQGRDARAQFWQQDADGIRGMDPNDARQLMELVLALFPRGQANLGERLADAVVNRSIENDIPVVTIGRKDRPGPFPVLMFDDKTGFLVQVGNTRLSDYRHVGSLKLPHLISWTTNTQIRLGSFEFNPTFASATFERPGGRGGWLGQLVPERPMPRPVFQTNLSAPGKLEIVRQPKPMILARGRLPKLPKHDATSGANWQVDLRGSDLSRLDLGSRLDDLLHADFDSNTRWPAALPNGFNPNRVLGLGQDPGLGVRQLHARGFTGKGIGIGIIDQPLLVDHAEYSNQLRLYEEIHVPANAAAEMHGPAVASIAVGRTCGVAPDADLYYIAELHGEHRQEFEWDFTSLAQSIDRLLEINRALPPDRKIRVISVSVGWSKDQKGYSETMAAVQRATADGVFVISTALRQTHHLAFDGLGRDAMANPNLPTSYRPGAWWAAQFWSGHMRFKPGQRLCVPMDTRSTASPTGQRDLVHYDGGGWSWCVPWIAGLYALACQVDPTMTPERFWAEALSTGTTITVCDNGDQAELGSIANPVALVERLAR
jgi:hypothetical protein